MGETPHGFMCSSALGIVRFLHFSHSIRCVPGIIFPSSFFPRGWWRGRMVGREVNHLIGEFGRRLAEKVHYDGKMHCDATWQA